MDYWTLSLVIGSLFAISNYPELKKQWKMRKYYYDVRKYRRIYMKTGSIQTIDPKLISYRPVGNEQILGVHDGVKRVELKSSGRYRSAGGSISFRVAKGVTLRTGGGMTESLKTWQITSSGRIILTDKAFVFEGDQKNERITWKNISDLELLVYGYKVKKRQGQPLLFSSDCSKPDFGANLQILMQRSG